MPIQTILGATGATGSAVLRFLLSTEDEHRQIHVFVRSKSKLLASFPKLDTVKNVQIFTSQLSDNQTLRMCLQDSEVIYNCIATNISTRGVSVARDSADAILQSLQHLRKEQDEGFRPPLLVLNRSSLLNSALAGQGPGLAIPKFALGYLFDDLRAACEKYEVAAKDNLLSYIFVDPPGLHDPDGTERTGFELVQEGGISSSISYADLGAALVEAARRGDAFRNQAVAVSATGKVRVQYLTLVRYLLTGLRARLLPF